MGFSAMAPLSSGNERPSRSSRTLRRSFASILISAATAGSACQHDTALEKVLRNRHVRPGDLNRIG
jgi:hypothetical protein